MTDDRPEILEKVNNIRDLSDFCLEWSNLKHLVEEAEIAKSNLSSEKKTIIHWLYLLAGKISRRDHL